MQIIKCDYNSQLRKDQGIHLKKINPQGSMARKLKTTLSSARPSDGEELRRIPWPINTMGVPLRSPMQHLVRKRYWGKRRGQESGTKVLPEGRTLMMLIS